MVADGYHSLVDGSNNVIGLIVAAFAFAPARPRAPVRPPQVRDRGDPRHRPRAPGARLGDLLGGPRAHHEAGAARDRPPQLGGHGRDHRREPLRELVRGARGPAAQERLPRGRRHAHAGRPLRLARRRGVLRGRARSASAGPTRWWRWRSRPSSPGRAVQILLSAFNVLTDRAVIPAELLEPLAAAVPGVLRVHDVRSRGRRDAVYVDLTVHLDGAMSLRQAHDVADRIEAELREGAPRDRGRGRPHRARGPRGRAAPG